MRPELFLPCSVGIVFFVIPIVLGFTWLRQDANRAGQPGIVWGILTIPFGWLPILGYVIVKLLRSSPPPTAPTNSSQN
jgi:hypothetical protein